MCFFKSGHHNSPNPQFDNIFNSKVTVRFLQFFFKAKVAMPFLTRLLSNIISTLVLSRSTHYDSTYMKKNDFEEVFSLLTESMPI